MTTSTGVATAPSEEPAAAVRGDLIMPRDPGYDDAPPQAGQPETGRRRWAVLAVVSAAQFLTILDLWVVNIALPALQHDFAPATLSDVSWILDVYAIVLAALLLPAGRAADSIGRREVLPGRARGVRRRVAGMRGGPGTAGADRLPGAAGGRGRRADAHLAGACAVGVPLTSAGHRGRGMGGRRRGSRWQRPGAGRAAGRVELALDLPHQRARHPGRPGGRRGDLAAARQRARQQHAARAAAGGPAGASTVWEPSWCWARWGWCARR